MDMTDDQKASMSMLEEKVRDLLSVLVNLGRVVILTSASIEWIERTIKACMPTLASMPDNILFASARQLYADKYPDNPAAWKFHSMRDIFYDHIAEHAQDSPACAQVVSIGDSEHERDAVWTLVYIMPDLVVKSVKMFERPDIEMLVRQLQFIERKIHDIVLIDGHADFFMRINDD
jgi:hypothetical protein